MKTFESFARELGFNMQVLDNYITFADNYYNTFHISKRNINKKRQIDCPSKELKSIQRWVLANYLNEIKVSNRANGFIKKRGIKRNSLFHLNKSFVLAIDIKDFFSSITQRMVVNALNNHFEDSNLVIKIAKLCTFMRRLPQGAPTSPALSNIVFQEIDDEITSFCNSRMVIYTRYADDLVFSSDSKNSLPEIYSFVNEILSKNSFTINKAKTKYLSGKGRMSITGININDGRLTVKKEIKKNLRSKIYKLIVKGDNSININSILGYLSFIKDIEPEYYEKQKIYIRNLKEKNQILNDFI
jgi:retron-type reverse transcriptase